MTESAIEKRMEYNISELNSLCDNSCPPLKPIAKSKYNEINFEEESGIFKSLLNSVAMIPSTKNNNTGFLKLLIKISILINIF